MARRVTPRVEDSYFEWLYLKFGTMRRPERSYIELCKILHSIPFHWFIFNDDNRETDGRELQKEFAFGHNHPERILGDICEDVASVLEVLVAFSIRCEYNSKKGKEWWMNEFLRNLGLLAFNDAKYDEINRKAIETRIDEWMARLYSEDGRGGLFPLKHPRSDQREVELWYQMQAYIMENRL